jgi:hypothetical protein
MDRDDESWQARLPAAKRRGSHFEMSEPRRMPA